MCACCGLSVIAQARHAADEPIFEELARIEQQASLVHSARASYSVSYLPTTPEEMRRINLFFRLQNQEYRAGSYYRSAQQDRRRSYRSIWFRQGAKEREERANVARPAVTETTVFDGEVVKTLDNTPFRTCLYIAPANFQWTNQSRIQPFSFAFEFRSSSHAELIRRSPQRWLVRRRETNGAMTEIVVRHPTEDRLRLHFTFDDKHRLISREMVLTQSSAILTLDRDEPAVVSRHEFFDHKPYDLGEGNTLWFPSKVILRYYLGNLSDGTPVQSNAVQIDIGDIEFNADIPAEKFVLSVPEGVTVYDHRDDRFLTTSQSY